MMSSRVIERKLLALITDIDVEKEQFIKQEQILRKETELLVSFYFIIVYFILPCMQNNKLKVRVIKNNASELIRTGKSF